MPVFTLTPAVFAILATLVEERSGLSFGPDKRDLFADRVSERALELGFGAPLDYYYYLRYDDPQGSELQLLVESLVVHESYFFREVEQLELAVKLIEREVLEGRTPRVWSAACAGGEEPLSLAMLLAERRLLDKVEIVATDISSRALARAREGSFGRRALRSSPPRAAAAPWIHERGDRLVVTRALVDKVHWRQANLSHEATLEPLGLFDVVLCRNVLIYFAEKTAEKVVLSLCRRLRENGVLFVGISESLIRFGSPPLECFDRDGVFAYRRVGHP